MLLRCHPLWPEPSAIARTVSFVPQADASFDEALVDQIENAIRDHYAARLSALDPRVDVNQSLGDTLRTYLDWRTRQIPPGPRAVHRSSELISSASALEHRVLLDGLIATIVAGEDLTTHLSRSAQTLGKHDGLLSDWGIQHLHFRPEGGMDELVFAVFMPGHAYLIGIYPHGAWGLQELAEIVLRNWPDSGIFIASTTAIGLERQLSDEDRTLLRRHHVAVSPIEYEGRVYFPRVLGQMADGSSSVAARQVMKFVARVNTLRWHLEAEMAAVQEAGERASGRILGREWQPALHEGQYGFVQDGVFVAIDSLL